LRQARLYRLADFFNYLDHNMVFSQVVLTLLRTVLVMFYVVGQAAFWCFS
jgi:hypothetical protein